MTDVFLLLFIFCLKLGLGGGGGGSAMPNVLPSGQPPVGNHDGGQVFATFGAQIKHAFRLCPVRIEACELFGIHCQGKFCADLPLLFVLHSSPYHFNHLADAFEWVLKRKHHIQDLMHYLDDTSLSGLLTSLSPKCLVHQACSFRGWHSSRY